MKMPIKYALPLRLAQDSTISQEIPERFKRLQSPFAGVKVIVMKGRWGILIHQIGKIAGQSYSEIYCEATEDVELEIKSSSFMITLHAVVKGSMQVLGPGYHVNFHNRQQSMHYVPDGAIYKGYIPAGGQYHSILIAPVRSLLQRIAQSYSKLEELLANLDNKSSNAHSLPVTKFKQSARNEIERMKNTRLLGPAREEYYQNRISDYVIGYLSQVHRTAGEDSNTLARFDGPIEALIKRIEDKPGGYYSVSEQAGKIGISQKLLELAFHTKLGTTVNNHVRNERMKRAANLLEHTNRSVSEISAIVGYADQSYFTRMFKRQTGYTPSEYRSKFTGT